MRIVQRNTARLMEIQGLNSVSLAKKAGISQRAAYRISRDNGEIESATLGTLEQVASALKTTVPELLSDESRTTEDAQIAALLAALKPEAKQQVLALAKLLSQVR